MKGRIYVGTSGWAYKEWGKKFFPKDLPPARHLTYLAHHFPSVEINASFYRLQSKKAYASWHRATPASFRFAVKVSRFITHIKRIKAVRLAWKRFYRPTLELKSKRGPYLLQFPATFTGKPEEIERIDRFLLDSKKDGRFRFALEFRHENCFAEPMLEVIRKRRVALVFANSSKYPRAPWLAPAAFVYFRLHGPAKLFASGYSEEQLREWAKLAKSYQRQGKDVYIYFNNDMHTNAAKNAIALMKLLGLPAANTACPQLS